MHTDIFTFCRSSERYFGYLTDNGNEFFVRAVAEAVIFFVYSGELTLSFKHFKIAARRGEYIFVRRGLIVNINKSNINEEKFVAVYIAFEKLFLMNFWDNLCPDYFSEDNSKLTQLIIKLPSNAYFKSLFLSMEPYIERNVKPTDDIINIKMKECLYCLMLTDKRYFITLFDFIFINNHHKSDILLNNNILNN